jgi:hypothetical protein
MGPDLLWDANFDLWDADTLNKKRLIQILGNCETLGERLYAAEQKRPPALPRINESRKSKKRNSLKFQVKQTVVLRWRLLLTKTYFVNDSIKYCREIRTFFSI